MTDIRARRIADALAARWGTQLTTFELETILEVIDAPALPHGQTVTLDAKPNEFIADLILDAKQYDRDHERAIGFESANPFFGGKA